MAPLVDELATGDRLRDFRDSIAPSTWKAYQRDLADYDDWLKDRGRSWSSPETIATYLELLEDRGAKYSTIARRLTAIHKLVEAEAHLTPGAVIDDQVYVMDPTKDLRVTTALRGIRQRIRSENSPRSKTKAAAPIEGSKLLKMLLSLDPDSPAGIRDQALLLVGWYGALRRSEIAGMRREHLRFDDDGVAVELRVSKAAATDAIWVPIPRHSGHKWDPVEALLQWIQVTDDAGVTRPPRIDDSGRTETPVWLAVHRGGRILTKPISDGAVNQLISRHALQARLEAPYGQEFSAHSLRAGFITEAKTRGIDEGDIMKHSRHLSLQMKHDNKDTWWTRNAASTIVL